MRELQDKYSLYPNTCVFLLCYSIDSQEPLKSLQSYWFSELKTYKPKHYIVLDEIEIESEIITTEQECEIYEESCAYNVIELLALNETNVDGIFVHVIETHNTHINMVQKQ
ncbi:hypothetical protein ENUP19_0050G0087 [Entamoeba nuttalli]|uniref:Uncharacterized protein n=1 Tax=Entamoeba nuttalli TaxID=412467 RepID=A0ABQ0DBT2_9EUKA